MRTLAWFLCAGMMGMTALAQQPGTKPASPARAAAPAGPQKTTQDAPPAHPITAAQVREMMRLTGAANLQKQMLATMLPYLKQSMPPDVPGDVLDDFGAKMAQFNMEPMILKSYQAHLSTEDAAQIIAFYKTSAGQRLIVAMPLVMKEMQQGGAEMGQQIMQQVVEQHHVEIENAEKKYQQEHPAGAPQN
ncbi:MAG TPA: DUF2059 domain-containing protein [Acidobacteriaceae bacterium]|nr:DUF2059 domain-containing protein [Acidobacteriaceae bacterium]